MAYDLRVKFKRGQRPTLDDIEKTLSRYLGEPIPGVVGNLLAIHAGKKPVLPLELALMEQATGYLPPERDLVYSAVVGVVRVTGYVTESTDPWFMGKFGWVLEDVRPLRHPVAVKGAMGVWRLSDGCTAEVLREAGL